MVELLIHILVAIFEGRRKKQPTGIAGPFSKTQTTAAARTAVKARASGGTWVCGRCKYVNENSVGFCGQCAGLKG